MPGELQCAPPPMARKTENAATAKRRTAGGTLAGALCLLAALTASGLAAPARALDPPEDTHIGVLPFDLVPLLDEETDADTEDLSEIEEKTDNEDPIEIVNRFFFGLNTAIYEIVLSPLSQAWDAAVPQPIDLGLENFIDNLKLPISALNSALQADGAGAGGTLARFTVNSTVGLLGFTDPATQNGWPQCNESLGQTLGRWGVGAGPYVMLPLFGPSDLRGTAGSVTERLLLPDTGDEALQLLDFSHDRRVAVRWGLIAVETLQESARSKELIEYIENNALDQYAFVRSLHRQNRERIVAQSCGDILRQARAEKNNAGSNP